MKAILRIPAKEMYGFIEIETEVLSIENALDAYADATRLYLGGSGLGKKEWNRVLDRYIKKGGMTSDEGAGMDEKQKWLIHELDKAFARIGKD